MSRLLSRAGLVSFGLLAACGGSAARKNHDRQPPDAVAGAPSEPPGGEANLEPAAGGALTGGGGASAGGGVGTVGGSLAGGGTSQGAAGSGAGGASVTLPLPSNCELRSHTETESSCSLAAFCDDFSRLTDCRRLASGKWQCQCENLANPDRVYQVESAGGLEACALTARFCSAADLKLGDETCEPTSESSLDDNCWLDLACARPIDLDFATDARAWLMRFGSATCAEAKSGKSFECACSAGNADVQTSQDRYDLLAKNGKIECRPLVDFCMSGKPPTFEGERQCFLTEATSTSAGCDRVQDCAVPMPLSSNISLAELAEESSHCEPRSGGGAECYCSAGESLFSFQLADAPSDASCEASMSNCQEGAVIKATGSASCERESLDTYGTDSCRAELSCLQNATVDGRAIVAEGRVSVLCERTEQGKSWWCSCTSDQDVARFALGAADADAEQACTRASTSCLDHLSVHLGAYGAYVEPPDPLP